MKALPALLITLLLAGCKHPLEISGEGDIVDASASGYGCTLEQYQAAATTCVANEVTGAYNVDYVPIPRPGWKFVRWDGACGPAATWPICNFSVSAPLLAFWDQAYSDIPIPALRAVFEPLTEADTELDLAGSFALEPLRLGRTGLDVPTLSFDVDPDNRLSWWLDLGNLNRGELETVSRVNIYNSFQGFFEIRKAQGWFIDRDTVFGHVSNLINNRIESPFVGRRIDQFPGDPNEDTDSDSDGVGNNADAYPGDATESQDSDRDGVGDNRDAYPHNAAQAYDSDGDGIADSNDTFPLDPNEYTDSDEDGVGDNEDHFPFDPQQAYTESSDLFSTHIATDVLQAKCLNCHYTGGLSGHTRLVFDAAPGPNQNAANQSVFAAFVADVDNAREYILGKIQGVNHGGGSIFSSGSDEFAVLAEYLGQLTGESGTGGGSNLDTFWNGVRMVGPSTTLRRAAIILAGRLPTMSEYQQAESGDAGLWQAIRGLMTGAGFHDFLIRGANDRLLTDALNGPVAFYGLGRLYPVVRDRSYELLLPAGGNKDDPAAQGFTDYLSQLLYGGAYAPLELIAHVVENEFPYTEILTADYTMVNPYTAEAFRSGVLEDRNDPTVFVPARNRGQIVIDGATIEGPPLGMGLPRWLSHSGFIDYPHAGVLSSLAFLNRYPSTETNRNRARARWTYYHFLGVDIEKSASRTTDAVALADTDNPTMNNPACSVCHRLHDPVAGAFQNHGNAGAYRESGGVDSLPTSYKTPEAPDGVPVFTPYQSGDTWYRDMRPAGIDGKLAPEAATSLPWLAREIANDPRFASASIKFWWQAVMGADPAEAPEAVEDVDFQDRLRIFEAQQAAIGEMAQGFRAGFKDGAAYNLKDLLTAMVIGPWFRADGGINSLSARVDELRSVGTRRLLTSEELSGKTTDLMDVSSSPHTLDAYGGYYGGIDSFFMTQRARSLNALMANVPELLAYQLACAAVHSDFNLPEDERRLFAGFSHLTSPKTVVDASFEVTQDSFESAGTYMAQGIFGRGLNQLSITGARLGWVPSADGSRALVLDRIDVLDSSGRLLESIEAGDLRSRPDFEQQMFDHGEGSWEHHNPTTGDIEGWFFSDSGYISLLLDIPNEGVYSVRVIAFEVPAGDVRAEMKISVEAPGSHSGSTGEQAIRSRLVELHKQFLNEDLTVNHVEIDATYQYLVDTWEERESLDIEGDGLMSQEECAHHPGAPEIEANSNHMVGTWVAVLIYLMTDFYFLHE